MASFEGLAKAEGRAAGADDLGGATGVEGRASPEGAGADFGGATGAGGFGCAAFTNFDCAAVFALSGTAIPFGASAFLAAAGFDSLHFSRSSSISRPL